MENLAKQDAMPWITPFLTVKDVKSSIDFYRDTFGFGLFENEQPVEENGRIVYASLRHKGGVFMLGAEGAYENKTLAPNSSGTPSPIGLYVYCDDVDKLYEFVKSKGVKITCEIMDAFWGDRMFAAEDPEGHRWTFATKIVG